jgi:segregation and condensation protein B
MERDWVKVVGHRDVPGKPAMYASTKQFLDYFNLKSLSDLPTLAEIRDIDSINAELDLTEPGSEHADPRAENNAEMADDTAEDAAVMDMDEADATGVETDGASMTVSDDEPESDDMNGAEQKNTAVVADPA